MSKKLTLNVDNGGEFELVITVRGTQCFVQDCAAYCQREIVRIKNQRNGSKKPCGCGEKSAEAADV